MSRFYRDTRLIENSVQKESTVPETKERPPKFRKTLHGNKKIISGNMRTPPGDQSVLLSSS